jgi:hypothetical protein
MSRGPEHVERAIKAAFAAEPDEAFTTEELCHKIYPRIKHVQKRHRVSVLRAAKKLQLYWKVTGGGTGRTLVFFSMPEEQILEMRLEDAKDRRRAALLERRKIYDGFEPCAWRAENPLLAPAFDAAHVAITKATADCNTIIDQINAANRRR